MHFNQYLGITWLNKKSRDPWRASYINCDDEVSLISASDAIIINGVMEAKQDSNVMINDVPNDSVKIQVPQYEGEEIFIMMIWGALVYIICEISPKIYEPYARFDKKNGENILYVPLLKALYEMLFASLLYYKEFLRDIEYIGFEVNPYDAYVVNKIVNGKQ